MQACVDRLQKIKAKCMTKLQQTFSALKKTQKQILSGMFVAVSLLFLEGCVFDKPSVGVLFYNENYDKVTIWSSKDMEKKELLFNRAVSLDFADFYYISLSPSCPELKYSLNQLEKMGYDKYFGQTYLAITNGKIVIKNPDDIKESSNPIHYSCEIKK